MTELTFLIELLLNHDLPKATKDLIAQRIKEVEESYTKRPNPTPSRQVPVSHIAHEEPVIDIAQTAAASAALAARQAAIEGAQKGLQGSMFKARANKA